MALLYQLLESLPGLSLHFFQVFGVSRHARIISSNLRYLSKPEPRLRGKLYTEVNIASDCVPLLAWSRAFASWQLTLDPSKVHGPGSLKRPPVPHRTEDDAGVFAGSGRGPPFRYLSYHAR